MLRNDHQAGSFAVSSVPTGRRAYLRSPLDGALVFGGERGIRPQARKRRRAVSRHRQTVRRGPQRANSQPSTSRRAGNSVLIVEDHDDTRDALAEILAFHGHPVSTARNGREALDALCAGLSPDLIILDLRMPVMDGWEFLDRKQRLPNDLATVPVVLFSSQPTPVDGVAASIGKGDLGALIDLVDRVGQPA